MKVSLSKLNTIAQANAIAGLDGAQFDAKTKWNVVKFAKNVSSELADFEKVRVELVKELGDALPKGGHQVKPENMTEYRKRVDELLAVEVEVHEIKLPLSQMNGVPVTAMLALESFVDEAL